MKQLTGLDATFLHLENATQFGLLLAGAVVVVLPVLAIFLVLQRHIMQGIAMTGIK